MTSNKTIGETQPATMKSQVAQRVVHLSGITIGLDRMKASCGDLREGEGLDRLSSDLASLSRNQTLFDTSECQLLDELSNEAQKIRMDIALQHHDVEDVYDLPDRWFQLSWTKSAQDFKGRIDGLIGKINGLHMLAYQAWVQHESYSPKLDHVMKPRAENVAALNVIKPIIPPSL